MGTAGGGGEEKWHVWHPVAVLRGAVHPVFSGALEWARTMVTPDTQQECRRAVEV